MRSIPFSRALIRGWEGRLRGRPLFTALALAAASAAFWGWASISPRAAILTFLSLATHAVFSPGEKENTWARAGLSFLVGGTWAAQQLILHVRFPH
jgi:hypothetical protein